MCEYRVSISSISLNFFPRSTAAVVAQCAASLDFVNNGLVSREREREVLSQSLPQVEREREELLPPSHFSVLLRLTCQLRLS